jgi:hypothetical protein
MSEIRIIESTNYKGVQMSKKNTSLRLTERDTEYITWIAEQQAVRLDTLQLLFEIRGKKIDPRALRRLVERWQRLGLVQKKILLAKSPSIIWPTIEGMRVANLPLSRGDRNYTPSFSSVHHTVATARVRIEYERRGWEWTCERDLRHEFGASHLADGLASVDTQRILVEVERTQKESSRLKHIMMANLRTKNITGCHYWTTDALYPVIQSNINMLENDLKSKMQIFLLPDEVKL